MKRIVLIGSEGYSASDEEHHLSCFPWERLSRLRNLSDFDDVIVNLLSLPAAKKVDWRAFSQTFTVEAMGEILRHRGRIILLGDPRFALPTTETLRRPSKVGPGTVMDWTRLGPQWDSRPGETTRFEFDNPNDRRSYGRYLSFLDRWTYSLTSLNPDKEAIAEAFGLSSLLAERSKFRMMIETEPYCSSRYGTSLACAVRVIVEEIDPNAYTHNGEAVVVQTICSGPLVLLPPTSQPEASAIETVLEDACGLHLSAEEASWVTAIVAPGQSTIDAELAEFEAEVEEALARTQAKRAEREVVRRPLKLLYGQHAELEAVVCEVFRALGATVEDPDDRTKEDGWVTVTIGEEVFSGVLEVKSTEKPTFDEHGLRQLSEWVSRGIELRGKKYKAIFVGNASASLPPEERPWPFGENFSRNAERRSVVALRSEDLYRAYVDQFEGTVDAEGFWRRLFSTDGVLNDS